MFESSCNVECFALFDCQEYLLSQHLFACIFREIQLKEASVSLGQPLVRLVCGQFGYLDLLHAVGTSQTFESFHGNFAASSHELDELCPLAIVEFLKHLPEPLDDC